MTNFYHNMTKNNQNGILWAYWHAVSKENETLSTIGTKSMIRVEFPSLSLGLLLFPPILRRCDASHFFLEEAGEVGGFIESAEHGNLLDGELRTVLEQLTGVTETDAADVGQRGDILDGLYPATQLLAGDVHLRGYVLRRQILGVHQFEDSIVDVFKEQHVGIYAAERDGALLLTLLLKELLLLLLHEFPQVGDLLLEHAVAPVAVVQLDVKPYGEATDDGYGKQGEHP